MPKELTSIADYCEALNNLGRAFYGVIARYMSWGIWKRQNPIRFFYDFLEKEQEKYPMFITDEDLGMLLNCTDLDCVIALFGNILDRVREIMTEVYGGGVKVIPTELTGTIYVGMSERLLSYLQSLGHLGEKAIIQFSKIVELHNEAKGNNAVLTGTFDDGATATVTYRIAHAHRQPYEVNIYDHSCTVHGKDECEHVLALYIYLDYVRAVKNYQEILFEKMAERSTENVTVTPFGGSVETGV